MQLNFLQEDLLAVMQTNSSAVPATALLNKPSKSSKPVQISFLPEPEVMEMTKPTKKSSAPKVVTVKAETVAEEKAPSAFKTISEAADILGVPTHVLRFWESQFVQISPTKSRGGRRYYRPDDMKILTTIKHLLYKQGYTIKGARKALAQVKDGVPVDSVSVAPLEKIVVSKPLLSDKQRNQLAAIRNELLGFKQQLTPYLA